MSCTLDLHLIYYFFTTELTLENRNTDGEFPYQPLTSKSSNWSGNTLFADATDNELHALTKIYELFSFASYLTIYNISSTSNLTRPC